MNEYRLNTIKQTNYVDCGCYILYFIRKIASSSVSSLEDYEHIFNASEAMNERKRIAQIISQLETKFV